MKRIIIVDDDEGIREVLTFAFEHKYKIETFENPKELFEEPLSAPSLFIFDIQMPYMDGLTLCKVLKDDKNMKHVPVIIMSAQKGFEASALAVGACEAFQKPFDVFSLINSVEKFI